MIVTVRQLLLGTFVSFITVLNAMFRCVVFLQISILSKFWITVRTFELEFVVMSSDMTNTIAFLRKFLIAQFALIGRLNSGNFRIFEISLWNFNLNGSDCRASKIISNDMNPEPMSCELNTENQLLNFCVGVSIRGRMRHTFHIYQKMRKKILHLMISISSQRATEEKGFRMKNRPKIKNYGG